METNNKSTHILNTSATLFGLCFVVFTSLKALKLDGNTWIDESTAISMFLFIISCVSSFLAIRTNSKKSRTYENVADYVFLAGLFVLFLNTVLIVFNILEKSVSVAKK